MAKIKVKTTAITIKLTEEQREKIREAATRENLSVTDLIIKRCCR